MLGQLIVSSLSLSLSLLSLALAGLLYGGYIRGAKYSSIAIKHVYTVTAG